MTEKVIALIADQLALEPESITLESSFEELGADSLDIVDLSMAMEEEFGVEGFEEDDLSGLVTVGDLVRYLKEKLED